MQGLLEIKDSETKETLFDNKDIKLAAAYVNSEKDNKANACIILDLNEKAQEKLEQIKEQYTYKEEENKENSEENTEENAEESETPEKKKLAVSVDEETLTTAQFGDQLKNGQIKIMSNDRIIIPLHEATEIQSELNRYYSESVIVERLINTGNLPIEYEIGDENVLSSAVRPDVAYVLVIVVVAVIVIAAAYLIIRYNHGGFSMAISWIGFIALFLLFLRLTNCVITVNSIVAIITVIIFDYMFIISLLRK